MKIVFYKKRNFKLQKVYASMPAFPPPITITSYVLFVVLIKDTFL